MATNSGHCGQSRATLAGRDFSVSSSSSLAWASGAKVPFGNLERKVEKSAADLAQTIAEKMELIGLLAVEMFLQRDGNLLVNELAPRPHNSGHWTIEGCATSQFEQHVRAVCGLPLGSTEILQPAAMANLLGDLWQPGEPNWAAALAVEGVQLHLYGKHHPRPRRKMGHLTALASNAEGAIEAVNKARDALARRTA